jgi:hypothetical protein
MSRSLVLLAGPALGLAIALFPAPGLAQKTTLAPGAARVSTEPKVIVRQIELAIEQEKKALAGYEAAGPQDSIEEAHQAAANGYVLIRSAKDGIGQIRARNKKFPDPVIDLVLQKMNAAWNRSRGPVDHLAPPGNARVGYLRTSVRQLSETIVMLEQVLLIWP